MDLRTRLQHMPEGSLVPAAWVLTELERSGSAVRLVEPVEPQAPPTWRALLWTCPAETRLGVAELTEALGRPKSWVYRATSAKSDAPRIPHRKFDGELVFVAGEVRRWIEEREEAVTDGRQALRVVTRARRTHTKGAA